MIKRQLVKQLDGEKDVERMLDLVKALRDIPMTIEVLKETEIGKVVSNVRKQTEGETSDIARELVRAWKAIAAVDRSSPRPASNGQKAAGESKQAEPKALERGVSTGSDKEPEFEIELVPGRQKVVDLLVRCLETDAQPKIAQAIAYAVEHEINCMFDSHAEKQKYMGKARMLKANLTQNAELRSALCQGELPPGRLVQLSPEEMATDEQRQQRQEAKNVDMESRRSDWLQVNREKIQKSLGIESTGGEFRCGKCKQNKTTHYAQQTRSADEPMTVFVTCLTCGNRWKTS